MVDASKSLKDKPDDTSLTKSTSTIGGALQRSDSTASNRSARSSLYVSSRYQRERVQEALQMVEREGAVIDAVMGRLEGLKLQV